VIAGRDGDAAHQEALRNLNAHLHRIEVVTLALLLRIASRVLDVFYDPTSGSCTRAAPEFDDDLPF
jgi:hypothetical protein